MAGQYQTLPSGQKMGFVGLGTWQSDTEEMRNAVFHAIECGYRHIDCALAYFNEEAVGQGIKDAIDKGLCKREDLFITSKLWNTFHRRDLVTKGCKLSLEKLGLEYLDLFLVHWAHAYKENEGVVNSFHDLAPTDENGKLIYSKSEEASIMGCWRGMEDCIEQKLAKNIGLSNHSREQISKILNEGKIKPAVLQIEAHPYFNNFELIKFAQENGIVVTAYSSFGSPKRPIPPASEKFILNDDKIKRIAKKHKKTPAQVVLRWALQRNTIVIPKSVTPSRIKENFNVWDFKLTQDDMKEINGLHTGQKHLSETWLRSLFEK